MHAAERLPATEAVFCPRPLPSARPQQRDASYEVSRSLSVYVAVKTNPLVVFKQASLCFDAGVQACWSVQHSSAGFRCLAPVLFRVGSFPVCYAAEFGGVPVSAGVEGVPMEHLISCVPGVELALSKTGFKVICFQENKETTGSGLCQLVLLCHRLRMYQCLLCVLYALISSVA